MARFPGASVEMEIVVGHPATISSDFAEVAEILNKADQLPVAVGDEISC